MTPARRADPAAAASNVAAVAALLGDRTRAVICLTLLDGRAWTSGELARVAGVSAATTSEHLDRLVAGGLLVEERQGRHRYVRLAGPEVAQLVETLAAHAGRPASADSYRAVRAESALAAARTCYDHLAGRLGVGLLEALGAQGYVDSGHGLSLTPSGLVWMDGLGIDVEALKRARRPLVRPCLDWTERRAHLAGSAAAALAATFVGRGWIVRVDGSRAIRVTDAGVRAFADELGMRAEVA